MKSPFQEVKDELENLLEKATTHVVYLNGATDNELELSEAITQARTTLYKFKQEDFHEES